MDNTYATQPSMITVMDNTYATQPSMITVMDNTYATQPSMITVMDNTYANAEWTCRMKFITNNYNSYSWRI